MKSKIESKGVEYSERILREMEDLRGVAY